MAITWKFRLINGDNTLDFGSNKVKNWDSIKLSFQRNETLRGVLFQYSNVFEFIEDVRVFVRDVVDSGGIEADLYLQMWVGNESGHRGSFEMLGTPLKASLGKTYTIDETSVSVTFAISGFEEMIINRLDTEIEYDIEESIDGIDIGAPIYQNIAMHDRVLNGTAHVTVETQSYDHITSSPNFVQFFDATIMGFESSSIQGINAVYSHDILNEFIFANTNSTTTLRIKIKDLFCRIYSKITNVDLLYGKFGLYITDYQGISILNVFSYSVEPHISYSSEILTINEDVEVTLEPEQFLQFRTFLTFRNKNIQGSSGVGVDISCANNIVITSSSIFGATQSKCILPHDAFERQIAKITSVKNAFKSNFFGRTILGYDSDGAGAYYALMNGKLIRSFSTTESKIAFKLKDLIKNYINGWNLVASIKDGKFIIEKIEDTYDFNNSIKIEITSKVKASLIEQDHVANIKYGFNDATYEEVNGLDSFIGQFERQTPIKSTDVKLDLTLPYRADDYGIEFTRRKDYKHYPTEDYRTDKDIFLIDCLGNGDGYVTTKKGTDLSISGILSPETAYNVDFRPYNLLKNWFNIISSGLYQLQEKSIKFVRGANNTKLVVDGVAETEDISISSLGTPLFLPYLLEFEGKLNTTNFNILLNDPNKLIEIGDTRLFGVIDDMEYDINTQKATFKLIRANR